MGQYVHIPTNIVDRVKWDKFAIHNALRRFGKLDKMHRRSVTESFWYEPKFSGRTQKIMVDSEIFTQISLLGTKPFTKIQFLIAVLDWYSKEITTKKDSPACAGFFRWLAKLYGWKVIIFILVIWVTLLSLM